MRRDVVELNQLGLYSLGRVVVLQGNGLVRKFVTILLGGLSVHFRGEYFALDWPVVKWRKAISGITLIDNALIDVDLGVVES
jgi:hypothetical protein